VSNIVSVEVWFVEPAAGEMSIGEVLKDGYWGEWHYTVLGVSPLDPTRAIVIASDQVVPLNFGRQAHPWDILRCVPEVGGMETGTVWHYAVVLVPGRPVHHNFRLGMAGAVSAGVGVARG
jgi:hypothetical protein